MQFYVFVTLLSLLAVSHTAPVSQPTNPVDVVSNSVSPLSANSAGNSNSNTGLLDGTDITLKRDASGPTDVVSNSLSPLSDNVAGNDNKNTGTLDGNTVTVPVDVAPTVNV